MSQQGLNQLERNYNYYYSDKYPDFDSFIKAYIGDIANANAYVSWYTLARASHCPSQYVRCIESMASSVRSSSSSAQSTFLHA